MACNLKRDSNTGLFLWILRNFKNTCGGCIYPDYKLSWSLTFSCSFKGRFVVKPHTNDIRMTYKYIRVIYAWHTSDIWMTYQFIGVTYRWHTNTYKWHRGDIRAHTSDIRMTYKYIWVTYGWHMSTYEWHKDDIRVHILTYHPSLICTRHRNDMRIT